MLDGAPTRPYNLFCEIHASSHLTSEAKTAPWIPTADAHAHRTSGAQAPAPQGPPPPDSLTPLTFRRSQRLTTPAQFRRVYAEGHSYRRRGLDVRILRVPSEEAPRRPARLGLSVRRVVVPSSVRRNQWKRWVREAFRRHGAALPPGCDVVVSVVADVPGRHFHDVEQVLAAAFAMGDQPSR